MAASQAEALAALQAYLLPLFAPESSAMTVITPMSKVEQVAAAFNATIVREDALGEAFPVVCVAMAQTSAPAEAMVCEPVVVAPAAKRLGFGWAKGAGRLCECPRCDKPDAAI